MGALWVATLIFGAGLWEETTRLYEMPWCYIPVISESTPRDELICYAHGSLEVQGECYQRGSRGKWPYEIYFVEIH